MGVTRLAFMPLLHRDRFLLISSAPTSTPIESFSPSSETYQTLYIWINGIGNHGATAFTKEEEMLSCFKGHCSNGSLMNPLPV